MRKVITILIFVAVALLLRLHFHQEKEREMAQAVDVREIPDAARLLPEREESQGSRLDTSRASGTSDDRSCDGRKRCSQMTSCEEATWFIENCPGMEMDGDNDGVPCETQWCGR